MTQLLRTSKCKLVTKQDSGRIIETTIPDNSRDKDFFKKTSNERAFLGNLKSKVENKSLNLIARITY